ncbi:MAG: uracil-DNA glycosylase [Methanobacteriota archaeon]|nr:MAG: uracil-DNA glycosylase [Euryarchaeota archaeon]
MNASPPVPADCDLCKLASTRRNVVRGRGSLSSNIVFIGEAPGKDEDLKAEPFVGKAGRILDSALQNVGVSRNQVFVTNVVKCRPPKNRRPLKCEVDACMRHLCAEIDCVRAGVICVLGQTAVRELLGLRGRMKDMVDTELTATICGRRMKCVIAYHPAACLYQRGNYESFRNAVEKGLKAADII